MPIVGNIAVQLQDSSGQAVRIFPDLGVVRPKSAKTVSCFVLETPDEPFQLVIASLNVNGLWVRVLVEEKLAYQSQTTGHGAVRGWLELRIAKALRASVREGDTVPASTRLVLNSESTGNIVVELIACSGNDATEEVFRCIFKPRPLSELQSLFPWSPTVELTSPPPSIAKPIPTTSSPPSLFTPTTRLYPSVGDEHEIEILHCCGLNLYGAGPDTSTGEISHTGIINCDNEWCQVPGQAWHKSCAGMEIWEEPKELWICPSCSTMPWEQMEVLEGEFDCDDDV
ncbi:hypothetical protein CBER1_11230 [Cercospora berteroae]|uniref:Uncharacterized protein n=1 Tax=Cercospora berteroae TaxID=357750 RepID=A0A2S6CEY2_9PEZI|nr:hypothetical protein CBER1_11230 [Cercospora berteroae]